MFVYFVGLIWNPKDMGIEEINISIVTSHDYLYSLLKMNKSIRKKKPVK